MTNFARLLISAFLPFMLGSAWSYADFSQTASQTAADKGAAKGTPQNAQLSNNQKRNKQADIQPVFSSVSLQAATPSPTPGCAAAEDRVLSPEVVECIDSGKNTPFPQHITMNSVIERGDSVTVPISGLKEWAADKEAKDHDPHALRLFISGHLLPNDAPSLIELEQGYVNFQLTMLSADTDERKAWIVILSEAQRHEGGVVPISVGLAKNLQPFHSVSFVRLRVYPVYTPYVVIGLVLLLIALIVLAWKSDLLRDTSMGKPPSPAAAPFSLGRMQMAWWFYLVVAGYVYICLITKDVNGLSATVLALIGISAGTGLAAAFVDKQKLTDQENQKLSLQAEQGVVQARISQLTQTTPAPGSAEAIELHERQKRLAEIQLLLSKYPSAPVIPASEGLIDVLKDGEGISFHRFQIAIWTIVLGLVFIRSVALQLTMPDFEATLLGLMGISSGTYIGFKFPEK